MYISLSFDAPRNPTSLPWPPSATPDRVYLGVVVPAKCVCGRDRLSGFQFRILYNMLLDNRVWEGDTNKPACHSLTQVPTQ